MKPLSIADYLDRLGSAAGEKAPPRREGSPFRPRSLPSPRNSKPGSKAGLRRRSEAGRRDSARGRCSPTQRHGRQSRFRFKPRRASRRRQKSRLSPTTCRRSSPTLMRRGREQGLAEGRVEASDRHAAELAAAREQAETQQQEFRLSEYAELEGAIRSGFKQVEDNIGGAVARILAPFLSQEVVKRAVDELGKAIARLSAGSPPGLIKIRGPERVLALLRERIAGLPIEVEYVKDGAC